MSKHLESYGFKKEAEDWVFRNEAGDPKTKYTKALGGGFFRYEMEGGVWRQYPHSIHKDWEGIGGLAFDAKHGATDANSKVKPECFDWIYPDEEIAKIYGTAVVERGKR